MGQHVGAGWFPELVCLEQRARLARRDSLVRVQVDSAFGPVELADDVLTQHRDEIAATSPADPVRLVYAAAHLVMKADYAEVEHTLDVSVPTSELSNHIDWKRTFELRRRLDALGFGIAEAMDTAQRFQIGWENAARLIDGAGELQLKNGFVAGAGVDHLSCIADEDALVAGVIFQVNAIQAAGGIAILLPLPWLCEQGYDEDGFVRVYGKLADALNGPLFVHWLGEMFLPALKGYFPGASFSRIMAAHPQTLRGAKLSLLDAELERRLRADLATRDQIMLTGDDFNFAELMAGGPITGTTHILNRTVPTGEFSHGLLGIFDGIAEPASLALQFLARGDEARYLELMEPCAQLSRHLFEAPTQHYKAGLAFLAWLNGDQPNAMLVQHEESARSIQHYVKAACLASAAGVIRDAERAARRLTEFLVRV
ncbi:MAG: dihydrodipicolinate synthase family protein [bacterium]|nr:dihydrodipicolinate synthase family protein [bacterium]